MRHKSKNKIRPLFTLSLEMTRLVKETRLLLVPGVNLDIYDTLCNYHISGNFQGTRILLAGAGSIRNILQVLERYGPQ